MLKIVSTLFLISLLSSCNMDNNIETALIWPDSLKEVSVSGRTVNFTVTCRIPTPCYDFDKYKEKQEGNHYFISFFAKHDKQRVCPQVVSSLNAYYKKTLHQDGEYVFHFMRKDSTSLDTVIVIEQKICKMSAVTDSGAYNQEKPIYRRAELLTCFISANRACFSFLNMNSMKRHIP